MLLLPPTGGVPPLPVFYSTTGTTSAPRAWSTKSTSPWTSSWRHRPSWTHMKAAYSVLHASVGGMPACLASRTTLHRCVTNTTIGTSALKRQRRPPPSHSSRPPLLSMYIPLACLEDPTGVDPSSQPLEERLISPGGGSGVTPASYSGECCSRSRSRSPGRTCFHPNSPGTIFGTMDVDVAEPPRSSLAGRLENPEETMFPLLGRGEIPNRVNVLLDGTKYLHVQFNDCLYQFEDPHRENVLRNIRRGIAPPLILTRRNHTTHRHDGLPKGAPGWGDEIAEWRDFIHRLSRASCAKKFAGVHKKTDPKHQEPPTDRRLRGFILEGYFAPCFQYDSNRNGWRRSFAQLFVVLGRYRAIVE